MAASYPTFFVSISVAAIATLISVLLSLYETHNPPSLLRLLAADQFAWHSSTTPIPISSVSVLAKRLLSRDPTLPPSLLSLLPPSDTIPIQPIRDFTNSLRLARIRTICESAVCNVDEVDPRFKLTPLHLAATSGDVRLAAFLTERGAVATEDYAGRMPRNLTFANFMQNSKRVARGAGRNCDFPVVEFDGSQGAIAETRRLVREGEPVLLKGAFRHYAPDMAEWGVGKLVGEFGDMSVNVGAVPYAKAFNLSTKAMSLRDYYEGHVKGGSEAPMYVFNKGERVCEEGYKALVKLVEEAFPTELVEHPDVTGGLEGIHFFFGSKGSGAPFHIHADALNAAVHGAKRWFVFTPTRTLYSRKTIKKWVEEDYGEMEEVDRPLECVQTPGDVVYVPLDWGHAVLNLEEHTFGYALELLNRRDTLSHLLG